MMKKLLIALALTMGFSGVAHAGILIEPYLGYESGKTTDVDGKFDGVTIGGRLAYKTPVMLWVGVDGAFGVSGKSKPDSGTGYSDVDQKHNTFYGVVGIDLPILLRGWVGYGFSDQIKLEGSADSTYKGKNFKIGLGFTGLPFVSLNAEYIKGKVDEYSGNLANSGLDTKYESVQLSVSLPLTF